MKIDRESKKPYLLIVEDDIGIQSQMRWCFDDYEVIMAADRQEALVALRRYEPGVITVDMGLPPDPGGTTEGLLLLEAIMNMAADSKVIVVTGNNDRESAVKAIGMGAYDFYLKPIDAEILKLIVNRAYRVLELEHENRRLHQQDYHSPLDGIVASSETMLRACQTVEKVAPTDATTLLLGESGTGKEILARALHGLSARLGQRFVAINCAAIPENLLESELFGYEKGAFTGAAKQTVGRIEWADKGTLFLDEIGDLPMTLQAKLLRFLQERVIERLGGRAEIPVDVRVICATHRDLPTMIQDGSFREDLYYRLSEITIPIPPLRERIGDTVLLAKAFLSKFVDQLNSKVRGFSQSALVAIESYSWPGNVRELENTIKRAVIMAEGSQIDTEALGLLNNGTHSDPLPFNLREVREQVERSAILRALNYVNGNVAKSAELLGVSRPTLYDLMKKYNVDYTAR
ncbi:MAG: PEP-CTERM-box response regulator transcription factor [Gammaproteobacteria bacterium]|nr:PEP-CTERM-box response regulator transcription factor [Gammaproteobacteria bacterium]MDH5727744.1 PEP-CTERM-box response regulator transcription factor [Gammaproteobacteria bacterium]